MQTTEYLCRQDSRSHLSKIEPVVICEALTLSAKFMVQVQVGGAKIVLVHAGRPCWIPAEAFTETVTMQSWEAEAPVPDMSTFSARSEGWRLTTSRSSEMQNHRNDTKENQHDCRV